MNGLYYEEARAPVSCMSIYGIELCWPRPSRVLHMLCFAWGTNSLLPSMSSFWVNKLSVIIRWGSHFVIQSRDTARRVGCTVYVAGLVCVESTKVDFVVSMMKSGQLPIWCPVLQFVQGVQGVRTPLNPCCHMVRSAIPPYRTIDNRDPPKNLGSWNQIPGQPLPFLLHTSLVLLFIFHYSLAQSSLAEVYREQ